MTSSFTKQTFGRPAQWEATGLQWLAEPAGDGGARIAKVLSVDETGLTEEWIESVPPTASAARDFGRALAATHRLESGQWGEGPPKWQGSGYQGPNDDLLELPLRTFERWGEMYAEIRLLPLLNASGLGPAQMAPVLELCESLRQGVFDTDDEPARIHGDLWTGNLIWSPSGCVLIDPSAHVGHRETDLANLPLFGCPYFDEVLTGYQENYPLAAGWQDRVQLHQLAMVLMHAVLFGGGYREQSVRIARLYV